MSGYFNVSAKTRVGTRKQDFILPIVVPDDWTLTAHDWVAHYLRTSFGVTGGGVCQLENGRLTPVIKFEVNGEYTFHNFSEVEMPVANDNLVGTGKNHTKTQQMAAPGVNYRQQMNEFFKVDDKEYSSKPSELIGDEILRIHYNRHMYKSLLSFVNSSGSGKTFGCLQLLKRFKAVYILCANLDQRMQTVEIGQLVRLLEAAEDLPTRNTIALAFIRQLEKALVAATSKKDVFDAQFNKNNEYIGISKLLNSKKDEDSGDSKKDVNSKKDEDSGDFMAKLGESLKENKFLLSALSAESKRRLKSFNNTDVASSDDNLQESSTQAHSLHKDSLAEGKVKTDSAADNEFNSDEPEGGSTAVVHAGHSVTFSDVDYIPVDKQLSGVKLNATDHGEIFVDSSVDENDSGPLVIFFDEADGLKGTKWVDIDDENCPLRCIQRAIDASSLLVGVFLCTTSRLNAIETSKPSARTSRGNRVAPRPFIEVCTHDLFQDEWYFLGRPLWYNQLYYQFGGNVNDLFRFAASKLIQQPSIQREGSNGEQLPDVFVACTLFALRFGFEPMSDSCETFVANHMAIMTSLDRTDSGIRATCKWLSEPILAEVAASAAMGFLKDNSGVYSMNTVVEIVLNQISSKQIIKPSDGDRGEVVVAALMGYTMDVLRKDIIRAKGGYRADDPSRNMSCSVPLHDFLSALGIEAPAIAKKYYINFTHFMRPDGNTDELSCVQAVHRRVAFFAPAGASALDLILIGFRVVNNALHFIPMRVQVKNLISKLTVTKAVPLLNNMSPTSKCQPCIENCELEIGIVVAVGAGGTNQSVGEAVCPLIDTSVKKESLRSSTTTSLSTHFVGYLLSIQHPLHFPTLSSYGRTHAMDRNDGAHVRQKLATITQYHIRQSIDVSDCFTEWERKHRDNACTFKIPEIIAGLGLPKDKQGELTRLIDGETEMGAVSRSLPCIYF